MSSYKLQPRRYYAALSPDSPALFRACWHRYGAMLEGGCDEPSTDDDVMDALDFIASDLVNDSASRFYMYG